MAKDTSILSPSLGLFLGISPLAVPERGLQAGNNFRIKQGKIDARNLGWKLFSSAGWLPLANPVVFIDNFFPSGQTEHLLFGTTTDIYRYDAAGDSVVFLTPREETGTVSATGTTTVTGSGTAWDTNGVKVNDEIHFGASGQTDPDATWYTITAVNSDTELEVGGADVSSEPTGDYTIRRLFQGQVSDLWSFDQFTDDADSGDDLWLGTNGVDSVVSWNGSDDQMTLHPELGFTCAVISVYENMAIYGDIVQGGVAKPVSIINSDVSQPLKAGSTGEGLSSQFRVHDGTDEIENMVNLGDNLVIYSARTVTMLQFVGDPLVFAFRPAISGVGAVGHHAIAHFGDFHVFLSADAQYEFDGVTVKETNGHVWREIIRQLDPIRKPRLYGHFDEENGDLIWVTPLATDADSGDSEGQAETAYTEHYLEETPGDFGAPYSKRDFPFLCTGFYERNEGITWSDLTQEWQSANFSWNDKFFAAGFPQNLAGDEDGNIWILNETQTAAGVAMPSFARVGRRATGSGRRRNLLTRIYPWVKDIPGTLKVRLYMLDHAAGEAVLTESFDFDMSLPEGEHFVSPFRAGRFMEVEFATEGDAWVMEGYDFDVREGGVR